MLTKRNLKVAFKCKMLFNGVYFPLTELLVCFRVQAEILEKQADQDHQDLLDFL